MSQLDVLLVEELKKNNKTEDSFDIEISYAHLCITYFFIRNLFIKDFNKCINIIELIYSFTYTLTIKIHALKYLFF